MGDYFGHWLEIGKQLGDKAPAIFYVNWFRKEAARPEHWLWPGFGENSRVLKWMFERVTSSSSSNAVSTPLGLIPAPGALDLTGLAHFTPQDLDELTRVDPQAFKTETEDMEKFFKTFGSHLPMELAAQLEKLKKSFL